MRFLLLAATILFVFAQSPSHAASVKMSNEQILEKIDAKMMLCDTPDEATKTCTSLAYYERADQQKIVENEHSIIEGVHVKSSTIMDLNDGQLCNKFNEQSINDYKFESNDPEATKLVKLAIQEVVTTLNGSYGCQEFINEGQKILSRNFVNGEHDAALDSEVKWVPHNHYTLR